MRGDFKQIAVRVTEVEGSHSAESSGALYRTFLDHNPGRLQMGEDLLR